MILDVAVTEYRHVVTSYEVGLTRDKHTESILRKEHAPAWFSNPVRSQATLDFAASRGFQWYVDKYSEVATQDPWDDISLFFRRAARVGQIRLRPPSALLYTAQYPILNTSAMASASEALAGWFCETHYNWDLLLRPRRVTPDMVLLDRTSRQLALVEVKSTSKLGSVTARMTTETIKLLRVLAATKLLYPGSYYSVLIMVQVEDPSAIRLTSLALEEA